MAFRGYTVERRVKLFCVTCSFAPDDLFFPVIVTAAIKERGEGLGRDRGSSGGG